MLRTPNNAVPPVIDDKSSPPRAFVRADVMPAAPPVIFVIEPIVPPSPPPPTGGTVIPEPSPGKSVVPEPLPLGGAAAFPQQP